MVCEYRDKRNNFATCIAYFNKDGGKIQIVESFRKTPPNSNISEIVKIIMTTHTNFLIWLTENPERIKDLKDMGGGRGQVDKVRHSARREKCGIYDVTS